MSWRKFVGITSAALAAVASIGLIVLGVALEIERSNACSPEATERLNNPDGDNLRTLIGCLPPDSPWPGVRFYAGVFLVPLLISVVVAFVTKRLIISVPVTSLVFAFITGCGGALLATLTPFDNFTDIAAGVLVGVATAVLVVRQGVIIASRKVEAAAVG